MLKNTMLALCGALLLAPAAAAETLSSRIKEAAAKAGPGWVEVRRQLHTHPETAGNEEKTAALVAGRLKQLGLEVQTGVGGHGVVALVRGGKPGPVVAYRADMDAVFSASIGDQPYKSQVPGVKHVCGHDAHVAIGIGVAELLVAVRDELPGTVKLIFQPAEENVQGARAMIEAGVLEDPAPRAIFAVHTVPFPTGTVVAPPGVGLTGWDSFEGFVRAATGAGEVAREVGAALSELNTVAPIATPEDFRKLMDNLLVEDGPFADFVFLQVSGPVARGVKGDRQFISGQVRAANDAAYARARDQIETAFKKIVGERAEYTLKFAEERFPDSHSDAALVRASIPAIEAALGEGSVRLMHASAPYFGEDFSLFQRRIPGAMFFLGVANEEKGITALNHFPDYDLDEDAIELGAVAMTHVLLAYLNRSE